MKGISLNQFINQENYTMLNTKLIFVDGLPGSGKSTIAHFIARQLNKNGIKAKWFIEMENDHPLEEFEKNKDETDASYIQRSLNDYPQKWRDYAAKAQSGDSVYIFESYPFQDILDLCLKFDLDKQVIKNFSRQLMSIVSGLNPVLIHFYQPDVEKAIRTTWESRGGWKDHVIEYLDEFLFCKNKNISGETACIGFFREAAGIASELFNEFAITKLQINGEERDWDNYRKQIVSFLGIQMVPELLYKDSFEPFSGYYTNKKYWLVIHAENNQLYLDDFDKNEKLLPLSDDEFEIEGTTIAFKFEYDENKEIKSLKITRTLNDDFTEGDVFTKFVPGEISQTDWKDHSRQFWC